MSMSMITKGLTQIWTGRTDRENKVVEKVTALDNKDKIINFTNAREIIHNVDPNLAINNRNFNSKAVPIIKGILEHLIENSRLISDDVKNSDRDNFIHEVVGEIKRVFNSIVGDSGNSITLKTFFDIPFNITKINGGEYHWKYVKDNGVENSDYALVKTSKDEENVSETYDQPDNSMQKVSNYTVTLSLTNLLDQYLTNKGIYNNHSLKWESNFLSTAYNLGHNLIVPVFTGYKIATLTVPILQGIANQVGNESDISGSKQNEFAGIITALYLGINYFGNDTIDISRLVDEFDFKKSWEAEIKFAFLFGLVAVVAAQFTNDESGNVIWQELIGLVALNLFEAFAKKGGNAALGIKQNTEILRNALDEFKGNNVIDDNRSDSNDSDENNPVEESNHSDSSNRSDKKIKDNQLAAAGGGRIVSTDQITTAAGDNEKANETENKKNDSTAADGNNATNIWDTANEEGDSDSN